ncbi:ATP-dependent 6-phosphofructokinase [Candidatus Sumerlaeota bacterium]|nr:ATP-dependent 6-phosphofructokinase [Candidatus Sumerlaeota bacterium]
MKRIGVITGGGDCPGLNAVLRGIVLKAAMQGIEVLGFRRGFQGLIDHGEYINLEYDDLEDLMITGSTALRTSRTNPFAHKGGPQQIVYNLKRNGCEALIVIGGYNILSTTHQLAEKYGLKAVCVPKSAQNGVPETDFCFGFLSAVNYATEAIDRLHVTASSYNRCLVIETTGQEVGWVALYSGLGGGVHEILIPEFPYNVTDVCNLVNKRKKEGKEYTLIAMAEGARPKNSGKFKAKTIIKDEYGNDLISGASEWLANQIRKKTGVDTRSVVLSAILRSGSPTNYDRILGLRFGEKAMASAIEGKFGTMVSLKGTEIVSIPLKQAAGKIRTVPASLYKESRFFLI